MQAVEDLCMHKLSSRVYDNLRLECENHINGILEVLVRKVSFLICDNWTTSGCNDTFVLALLCQELDHAGFLIQVDSIWKDHIDEMGTIRNIFIYLDRLEVLLKIIFKLYCRIMWIVECFEDFLCPLQAS